jgi:hypothetical protein
MTRSGIAAGGRPGGVKPDRASGGRTGSTNSAVEAAGETGSKPATGPAGIAGLSSVGADWQVQTSRSGEAGCDCDCDWQQEHGASEVFTRFAQQHDGVLVSAAGSHAQTGGVRQPARNVAATMSRHRPMRVQDPISIGYPSGNRIVKGTCLPAAPMDAARPQGDRNANVDC